MNKVENVTTLLGEYKIAVINRDNTIAFESNWSRNTILSSGLVSLYNGNVEQLLQYVDFGKSTAYPGSQGYMLSGIIEPPDYYDFINVKAVDINTYVENLSVHTHYVRYETVESPFTHYLNEFCIKGSPLSAGFCRNTFLSAVEIQQTQRLRFEYRLKTSRYTTTYSSLPFYTNDGYTFTIPITSVVFNVPYKDVFISNHPLILLSNKDSLPTTYNIKWPTNPEFGLNSKRYSTFLPTEIRHEIDNDTRSYTVSTVYDNISATPASLFNNINTLLLLRPQGSYNINDFPFEEFHATRIKFPLTLYNLPAQICDAIQYYYYYTTNLSRHNIMCIFYNFTWKEYN